MEGPETVSTDLSVEVDSDGGEFATPLFKQRGAIRQFLLFSPAESGGTASSDVSIQGGMRAHNGELQFLRGRGEEGDIDDKAECSPLVLALVKICSKEALTSHGEGDS
eukprot:GFKZ01014796.1.p2 GENE.GFKZ01014796.1~~GFKZ01014796.1.p2  ORF type:complete len:108 (-),score=9.82 GFKZ01014796.1:1425-1748(-)